MNDGVRENENAIYENTLKSKMQFSSSQMIYCRNWNANHNGYTKQPFSENA